MKYLLESGTFQLRFRHAFHIAHGKRYHTDTVITTASADGLTGYGEAALPPYLGYSSTTVADEINNFSFSGNDIHSILDELHASELSRPAKASADIALYDLWAKQENKSVHQLLQIPASPSYPCFYTLGISSIQDLEEKLASSRDTKIYKIKLGSENDFNFLKEFRKRSDIPFCADANQAWKSKKEALNNIEQLHELGCIFIEQPLPVGHPDLNALHKNCPLPIYLDESLQSIDDIHSNAKSCSGINIKLVKTGGIRPAMQWIAAAKEHGLKILMGCMSESTCGAAAALQLAGTSDFVDLDGPLLIANDPFSGIAYSEGEIQLPTEIGLGIFRT
jgi:L-alanine-DL-glutamate epimerase-like enolase superfamily enzyme